MNALGFTPNVNYLYKRLTQILLLALIVVSITTFLGRQIGYCINPSGGTIWGVVISLMINLACLGLTIILVYKHYRGLFYEIHEDEVIMHAGVITRSVTHVPFQMITNIKLRRCPLDRLLKLGTIDIQTAGEGEYHCATESLVGLQNYKEIYDKVTMSIRLNRNLTLTVQEKEMSHPSEQEMLRILLNEVKKIQLLLQDHHLH
jgi:membrane protein YdbS with pleckstrin-like domain